MKGRLGAGLRRPIFVTRVRGDGSALQRTSSVIILALENFFWGDAGLRPSGPCDHLRRNSASMLISISSGTSGMARLMPHWLRMMLATAEKPETNLPL